VAEGLNSRRGLMMAEGLNNRQGLMLGLVPSRRRKCPLHGSSGACHGCVTQLFGAV
jgi:hypothetical protein